ncbi:MAG: carboxypeptidase regulatory-like domain-containing protein [Anaerolineae bacterium]|nr:carboxypeptidase regulatory-like domain-containing protein [Anaerolineae bacterium]
MSEKVERRRRGLRIVVLLAVGLAVGALVLLYLTAPSPTVLVVQVLDATSGEPLPGAVVQVQAQGEQPWPAVTTDEEGVARFRDLPPGSTYVVRVQKLDYDLVFQPQVVVPEGKETTVSVPLAPHAGDRLYVGLDWARVTEIDTASLLPVRTIRMSDWKLGPVSHIRIHPSKELLYTIVDGQGYIVDSRYEKSLGRLRAKGEIGSLDLTVDGRYALATGAEDGAVTHLFTFDAESGKLMTDTLLVADKRAPQIVWQPDGTDIYVLMAANRLVWAWGDGTPVWGWAGVPTGSSHERAVISADGRYVYQLARVAVDPAVETRILTSTVPLTSTGAPTDTQHMTWSPGPVRDVVVAVRTDRGGVASMSQPLALGASALAASPIKDEVYVLNDYLDTLSIVDPSGQAPTTIIAVGKGPRALTISADGKWAYVANRESRTISAVYLPSARVVHTIPLEGEPISLGLR